MNDKINTTDENYNYFLLIYLIDIQYSFCIIYIVFISDLPI